MEYLSQNEAEELIERILSGDDSAWKTLYEQYDKFIHRCVWDKLNTLNMLPAKKKEIEEDLYAAGWTGFVSALKNYVPKKGGLLTYAKHYIDGEISKELCLILNPLGLVDAPSYQNQSTKSDKIPIASSEDSLKNISSEFERAANNNDFFVDDVPVGKTYSVESRVLQILEILKLLTDENHNISKKELFRMLKVYRGAKYNNIAMETDNTISTTLNNMLTGVNPSKYTEENKDKYRIIYKGYREDRLKNNQGKREKGRAFEITDFSYVHTFSNDELNKLIQLVSFTDMISDEEKQRIVEKLVSTASLYYKTPFWDGKKIKFCPNSLHSRLSRRNGSNRQQVANNLSVIQEAINNLSQIKFLFNRYNANCELEPTSEYIHMLSPYHLVVYHDNYYCIGLKKSDKRIWHYRVDLMTEVEIVRNEAGKMVPIEVGSFDGLPIANLNWNPEKYMSEHLYMAYDEPRIIRIKIKNTNYTILHDWFGEHFEKTNEPCEEGYDIVAVKTSPTMIIHWAMQYANAVEIMDKDIRETMRGEIKTLWEKYNDK